MGPIIFFIIIVGIDLFLKSIKEKKKIQEVRRNREEQLRKSMSQKESKVEGLSLEGILKKDDPKSQYKEMDLKNYEVEGDYVAFQDYEFDYDRDMAIRSKTKNRKMKPHREETEKESSEFERDVLRGIIFAEILSEPKSIQNNKRRSM